MTCEADITRAQRIRRYLDKRFSAPKGQCGACKKPLPRGRRRWCSDKCSDLFLSLVNTTVARARAFKASKVCALCGCDVFVSVVPGTFGYEPATVTMPGLHGTHTMQIQKPVGFDVIGYDHGWRYKQHRTAGAREAELDHVVPLVEGGDHDWHNLRLICQPCHVTETGKLAKRRAAHRREAGNPSLPGMEVAR